MKEYGLVTLHDQLKFKKLMSNYLNRTSSATLPTAIAAPKGKRSNSGRNQKMLTDDKQLYYTMYVYVVNAHMHVPHIYVYSTQL